MIVKMKDGKIKKLNTGEMASMSTFTEVTITSEDVKDDWFYEYFKVIVIPALRRNNL
jgi:hypothetical protein